MNLGTNTPTHILSGWKEIANYLGKGVRTVQRYEADLHLPVRRPAGKSRGSVVATKEEIDSWVTGSPIREQLKPGAVAPTRPVSFVEDIKRGIEKMNQLRLQMAELRLELRDSVDLLRASVCKLQAGLQLDEVGSPRSRAFKEARSNNALVLAEITEEVTLPKAS